MLCEEPLISYKFVLHRSVVVVDKSRLEDSRLLSAGRPEAMFQASSLPRLHRHQDPVDPSLVCPYADPTNLA